MNPVVVSFVTDTGNPGVARLHRTCVRWGWPFDVVVSPWVGWGGRLKAVLGRADILRDQGYTHLVHVDGYDVVCTGPVGELPYALALYGYPAVLLAAEAGCWPPDPGVAEGYEPRGGHWWYAHSQYVYDLNQPLPAAMPAVASDEDDQRHLHRVFLANTPGVVLDRSCAVVQSIAHCHPYTEFFEVTADRRVRNRSTGTWPLFMHGNGRTEMEWVPA